MTEKKSFVVMLRPAPEYGSKGTENIVNDHFNYLKHLKSEGKLLMAGRLSDFLLGLVMLEVDTKEEAISLLKNDPAVKAGIFHGELHEWRIALGPD